jgi:DNA repair protein RecO (recombination protein O)
MQQAYVLHTRLYRDTSLLVEFFAEELGRLTAVARGARGQKSPFRGVLQPFNRLLIDTVGKHELQTLRQAEPVAPVQPLKQQALFCGFYLNELLMRVLIRHDPYPELFHAYANTLVKLGDHNPQTILRIFEKKLLRELGYGLQVSHEYQTQNLVRPDQWYYYDPEQGVTKMTHQQQQSHGHIFVGQSLLDLAQEQWGDANSLHDAKRLMRLALAPWLGNKPLKSRELFDIRVKQTW